MQNLDSKKSMSGRHEQKNVFVIIHPRAGHANPRILVKQVEAEFNKAGWHFEIYKTTGKENLSEIVRDVSGKCFDIVAVAGGDGTVSDAAEGLVHSDVPLAIIPVGTGNILARELRIPTNPLRACLLMTRPHSVAQVDAMRVNGRHYFLNLSAGFASLMIRDTRVEHKRIFGTAAYLWTGMLKLFGFQPRKFEIEVDGEKTSAWAAEVSVANSGILAMRPFNLGNGIRTDDGKLDVCIIRARTIAGCIGLAVRIIMHEPERDKNISYIRAYRRIILRAEKPLVLQADGEIIGETPVEIDVVPHAVKVIVPEKRHPNSIEKFVSKAFSKKTC